MAAFIVARIAQSLFVLLLVTFLAFLIIRLSGDPVAAMIQPGMSQEQIDALRQSFGLDRPLYVQFLDFITGAARGDLGTSIRYSTPTVPIVLQRFPATLELAVTAMAFAVIVGVPAGTLAALRWNTRTDFAIRSIAFLLQGIPFFWLAIMLILVVAVHLHWLPTSGRGDLAHLILPALTLSLFPLARITRLLRASLLAVMREDYIAVARAKGLTPYRIVRGHALKNALLPVVTDTALQFGALLSGAIIVETIFAWPGIGRLAIDSISSRDYPMVQTLVVFNAAIFVGLNLLADLSYAAIDPRIRQ